MSDPLDAAEWPIRTDRLVIRRAAPRDIEETWRWRRLPEVAEWLGGVTTTYEAYLEKYLAPERLARTQVIEFGGRLVGDFMVDVRDAWSQDKEAAEAKGVEAELGWTLDPAFGGRGIATEAARAIVEVCFTSLGVRRLTAECFADNEPSWRLMERLGMRRENHGVRDGLHPVHGWTDSLNYALLAEEWPTAHV